MEYIDVCVYVADAVWEHCEWNGAHTAGGCHCTPGRETGLSLVIL